jgi:hypothetical protein
MIGQPGVVGGATVVIWIPSGRLIVKPAYLPFQLSSTAQLHPKDMVVRKHLRTNSR